MTSSVVLSEPLLYSATIPSFANEGIVAEYNSGSDRTTLEVIQSNALLLDAQISLADSERNYILSQFNLLKSVGLLNSEHLKIR